MILTVQQQNKKLQRGRALARAEMLLSEAGGFAKLTLQRGRALARAEIRRIAYSCFAVERASTGPRTCARGDDGVGVNFLRLKTLQRGRALARAEMCVTRRARRLAPPLQRGRALARAEMSRSGHANPARRYASTGPRTCARGDSIFLGTSTGATLASTGPRTCARGDADRARLGAWRCSASTGPRTCARGDPAAAPSFIACVALQRGRALARAEIAPCV